jgi:flavodoxin
VLVVYYSWTGHTREIAEVLADELRTDREELGEVRRFAHELARAIAAAGTRSSRAA